MTERVRGTALEGAPIVACSSTTGEGFDELVAALDAMLAGAPEPDRERPPPPARRPRVLDQGLGHRRHGNAHRRAARDRRGGRAPAVRDPSADPRAPDAPPGRRDRVAGLEGRGQPHRRPRAHRAGRGPGPGRRVDRHVRPRGAHRTRPIARPPDHVARRVQAARGRGRTRRADPPLRRQAGAARRGLRQDHALRTARPRRRRPVRPARVGAARERSPAGSSSTPPRRAARARPRRAVCERGRGRRAPSSRRSWSPNAGPCGATTSGRSSVIAPDGRGRRRPAGRVVGRSGPVDEIGAAVTARLAAFHAEEPAAAGEDVATVRRSIADAFAAAGAPRDLELADAVIDRLETEGALVREGAVVRLASHRAGCRRRGRRARGGRSERRADTADDRRAPRVGRRRRRPGRGGALGRPRPDLARARASPASSSNARRRSSARPARTASP